MKKMLYPKIKCLRINTFYPDSYENVKTISYEKFKEPITFPSNFYYYFSHDLAFHHIPFKRRFNHKSPPERPHP